MALPEALREKNWVESSSGKAIEKAFVFADFPAAIAWMTQMAFVAERLNHHPEWHNVYNRVFVRLTTHDAGGVTSKDHDLANRMDALFHAYSS